MQVICFVRTGTLSDPLDQPSNSSPIDIRRLLDAMPDALLILDRSWRITYINREAARINGKVASEFLGKTHWEEWPSAVGTEVERNYRRAMDERIRVRFQYHFVSALHDVSLEITAYPFDDGLAIQYRDISAEQKQSESHRERLAELSENLEKEVSARTGELKKKEEELHQSRKLDAVGQLAGGIAHDFNNLLTAILGCSDMLEEEMDPEDPNMVEVLEIKKAATRASTMTCQLLALGRRQVISPQRLNLNKVISETGLLLRRLIGENIQFTTRLDPDVGDIFMDQGQIDQILINLTVNAQDAMSDGGQIVFTTENVRLSGDEPGLELPKGNYVMLGITDTGVGMSQEIQEKIFEPFFTTKAVGKGTGLGLATVYGILKQNNGGIAVSSHPGVGTSFKIFFCRDDKNLGDPLEAESEKQMTQRTSGTETILVVEDEALVLAHISRLLKKQGYRVLTASHGKEGLDLFKSHRESIGLVLTDVIMPEMNGRELANQITEIAPATKVIYMSGYPREVIGKQGLVDTSLVFIEKPFRTPLLLNTLRKALDTPAPNRQN